MPRKKKTETQPLANSKVDNKTATEIQPLANSEADKKINDELLTSSNAKNLEEKDFGTQLGKSAKAEEYALSLAQQLDRSRVNIDRLKISINDRTVFGMKDGEIDRQTNISDEQAELIKEALKNPSSFDGDMKISQGGKTLLHIKDGKVLVDSVGLVQESAKVELNVRDSRAEKLYNKYSSSIDKEGLNGTREIAKAAFNDGLEKKDIINMIKTQDSAYQDLRNSVGEQMASKSLDKIVNNAQVKALKNNSNSPQKELSKSLGV